MSSATPPVHCACGLLHRLERLATLGQQDVFSANPLVAQWIFDAPVGNGARDQVQQMKLTQAREDVIGLAVQLRGRLWMICRELCDQEQ